MFRSLQARVIRGVAVNSDLIGVWFLLLIGQHMVPPTHFLARDDLIPWMVLTLSIVGFLRAKPYGYGPHPMLTPRVDHTGSMALKGAAAAAPWGLMFLHDALFHLKPTLVSQDGQMVPLPDLGALGTSVAIIVGVIIANAMGSRHGQTAWVPDRRSPYLAMAFTGTIILMVVGVLAMVAGSQPDNELVLAFERGVIIGAAFLSIGFMMARVQNHWQRKAAGRKDNTAYGQQLFPAFLATVGPASTLFVVFFVVKGLTFNYAFVISLLIVVWAGVVWPKPSPIMVSCVLHEVQAVGGADATPAVGQANAFDMPPEGALRFNPLATRRTLVMHPWLVPVRSSRIAELDDPIRPLWEIPPPLVSDHILGDASFEPDPDSKQDQWNVITIRLRGRADMQSVKGGDSQTKRMVILRPFPATGRSARARLATYRWEEDVPEDTIQILDATTQTAELRDGDILLLSSEGVAKAFEIEIGAPVYRFADANAFRPPQLEDYVEVG